MELPSSFGDKIKKDKNKRLFDAYSRKPAYGKATKEDAWEEPNNRVATSRPQRIDGLTIEGEEQTAEVVCKREEYTERREVEVQRVRVEATLQGVTVRLFQITERDGVIPPECQALAEFIIQKM